MCILHPNEIEVFFPIRAFLGERHIAETDFDPFRLAVIE